MLQGAAASIGNSSGDDSFITGLRQYLAAHKFGSAITADLWDALGQASGVLRATGQHLHTGRLWERNIGAMSV